MRIARATALLTFLAGCASPGDLIESGHQFRFTSNREPKLEANCIARNAERHPATVGTSPTVRESEKLPGAYEVVISMPTLATTDAFVVVEPVPWGSAITVFALGPKGFYENRAREYVEGCSSESPRRAVQETVYPPPRPTTQR